MSGIKPFSNASHRGYAAIRAEQEREAQEREAQQAAEKAQRDQDTAKLVNSIHARTIYYDKLSNAQKKALNSWASSLPRPEGASDFKTFYEGPYGYGEPLPKSSNMLMDNNGNPNASKQKKPGKSAKRKSSTRKTKRSQKQC
jgi:regulator of protease activity HflC (stomatin/prohibitin superfamily)